MLSDQSWVALLVCNFGVILTPMLRLITGETTKASFNTQTSFKFRDATTGSQGQFELEASRTDGFDGSGKMLPLSVIGEHRDAGDQPVSFWKT
jgi:hypothetical protein